MKTKIGEIIGQFNESMLKKFEKNEVDSSDFPYFYDYRVDSLNWGIYFLGIRAVQGDVSTINQIESKKVCDECSKISHSITKYLKTISLFQEALDFVLTDYIPFSEVPTFLGPELMTYALNLTINRILFEIPVSDHDALTKDYSDLNEMRNGSVKMDWFKFQTCGKFSKIEFLGISIWEDSAEDSSLLKPKLHFMAEVERILDLLKRGLKKD